MITILGLGPGDPKQLTREAWGVLAEATVVHLRTRRHPTVAGLPPHLKLRDYDHVYDSGAPFEKIYKRIVDALLRAAKKADVIYAVPGHPLVGEATTPMLLARARELKIKTRIVAGMSFIEPVLEEMANAQWPMPSGKEMLPLQGDVQRQGTRKGFRALAPSSLSTFSLDPLNGLQICDALDLARMHHPPLNPDKPALVAQIYSRAVASDVKLTLMNQYPPLHGVWVVRGGGEGDQPHSRRRKSSHPFPFTYSPCCPVTLSELDHGDYFHHLTALYVPALPRNSSLESLQALMAHLRAPEGCPWDQVQTHASLRVTLLEEAYEVLTAIDEGDMQALKEELGDLLFNIVFQVQMATEAEVFRMVDVIGEVHAKLVRRHPHVFGAAATKDVKAISANWDAIKQQEHKAKGQERISALDGIPPALPALAQAQKMAHKAEKAGFRYENNAQRMAKVLEELDELSHATDPTHVAEEFGDLMFSLADLADGYGIDAETAAREANAKFAKRFRALEQLVKRRKQNMAQMNSAELQAAWRQVKQQHNR